MIEDDRYCIDILTQLGAVSTALEAVALKVLEEHVQHCVAGALASGDPAPPKRRAASCSRRSSASPRPIDGARRVDLTRTAVQATLHCLTGCAIGEVLGMVIATALGLGQPALDRCSRSRLRSSSASG